MTVPITRFVLIVLTVTLIQIPTLLGQRPIVAPVAGSASSLNDQSAQGTSVPIADSNFDSCSYCNACDCPDIVCACTSKRSCCKRFGCDLFGRGLIKPSDHAFDNFISPMTNPVFFEDPRNVTEARAIYLRHKVPLAAGSGEVQLFAVQLRARLSENVSLIATKDGYILSSNPLIADGWSDLSAGLKFNLIRDSRCQRLLSAGFMYELPTGEADPLQGNGHGELNLFLTGGKRLGCNSHWISAVGLRAPFNTTDESTSCYWSNHLDYRLWSRVYVFGEANWYHWLKAGVDGPVPGVEGLDLFNLGSPGVAGNDIVTSAFGLKFKPDGRSEIGLAFEFPLTEREDVLDNRLTVDWIFRY